MRQGIVIFADAPGTEADAAALRAVVDAAVGTGATPYLAYAQGADTQALRAAVGGPPPRFFPQATRNTLGERMAQAFAFMFVQGIEQALLVTGRPDGAAFAATLDALGSESVKLDEAPDGWMVALKRQDFPRVAAIFDEVAWEKPDALEAAGRMLDALAAEAT